MQSITNTRPEKAEVDPAFIAEVDRRCTTAMRLARQGAIRGSVVLHLLEDGTLWGYSFGEMHRDLRALAAKLSQLDD